jgi:branched-chain amino acid transport system ATP-binding protein
MSTLTADGITKRFGGLMAVDQVSLEVPAGRVTSLIGPNGAGKTTFFNCLTGLLEPDGGAVRLDGEGSGGLSTHVRAQRGLGRTFQRLEVFTGLTVFENLQVAAEATRPAGTFRATFRLRHRPDPAVVAEVEAALETVGVAHLAHRLAGDLPTAALRLVELGRALCSKPRVLLLDELASGLDETETEQLGGVLTGLARSGLAVLLIEHDMELVMAISDRVYVMEFGRLIAEGTPHDVATNPAVRAAYLGGSTDEEDAGATARG